MSMEKQNFRTLKGEVVPRKKEEVTEQKNEFLKSLTFMLSGPLLAGFLLMGYKSYETVYNKSATPSQNYGQIEKDFPKTKVPNMEEEKTISFEETEEGKRLQEEIDTSIKELEEAVDRAEKKREQERERSNAEVRKLIEELQTKMLESYTNGLKLEEMAGESGQLFKEIFNSLPDGITQEVEVVSFVSNATSEERTMPEYYELPEGSQAEAVYWSYQGKSYIKLYSNPEAREALYRTYNTLLHELGHANDYRDDDQLNEREKKELEEELRIRVLSPDRYISYYVEEVKDIELKVAEYWGEIFMIYFSDPGALSLKDFKLVDKVVKKGNPEFNLYDYVTAKYNFQKGLYLNEKFEKSFPYLKEKSSENLAAQELSRIPKS